MDILARDGDPRRASPREARLWGLIGVALVIGILGVVGYAWKNDRVQLASTEVTAVRIAPAPLLPDLPLIP